MSDINISSSSSGSTGDSTSNPQSTGQGTSISGGSQNPQNSVSSNLINTNTQSTSASIPLVATNLTSPAVKPTNTKSSHSVSDVAFIPIAILVIVAVVFCAYIYKTSKNKVKDY